MRAGLFKFAVRKPIASLVLAAFALRALVPAGFMLASGHPLTVIICPDGFPAQLLSQAGQGMPAGAGVPDGAAGMPDMAGMPAMPGRPSGGHTAPRGDHHGGAPAHSDHCLFTSGSGHGPLAAFAAPIVSLSVYREVAAAPRQRVSGIRLVYVPQPRAPPIPA